EDKHSERRARGDVTPHRPLANHAGKDTDRVRLAPLRREARLAGPTAVEMVLDAGGDEWNPRRTATHHAADRRPMALAKRGKSKKMSERIERHSIPPA